MKPAELIKPNQLNQELYCTIVSLLPFPINGERKPEVDFYLRLPAAPKNGVAVAHVPMVNKTQYIGDWKKVTIPLLPNELAGAIVFDYCTAQLAYSNENGENRSPGLFYVNGKLTAEQVEEQYPELVAAARELQHNWFTRLVEMADDTWNRIRRHDSIANPQRIACRELGLEREWDLDPKKLREKLLKEKAAKKDCPACGSEIKSGIVRCPHCSCILDPKRAKEFVFADLVTEK